MAFLSLAAGALTGGGFSLLTKGVDLIDRHLKHKQETAIRKADYAHELLLLDKQGELAAAQLETEREIAIIDGNAQTLSASYEHDASYGTPSRVVGTVLRFFRPLLTLLLLGASVWGMYRLIQAGHAEPELIASAVDGLLYLTSTSISWWFGDRSGEKNAARK